MKTFLLTLLTATVGLLSLQAQTTEFAPIGARWVRAIYPLGYIHKEIRTVVGDTVLLGNSCRIIQTDMYHYSVSNGNSSFEENIRREYIYAQGDAVYYYRGGAFYTLYDFAAQVGDSWDILPPPIGEGGMGAVRVDSIGTENIDGHLLRCLWVSAASGSCYSFGYEQSKIIERIGTVSNTTQFPDFEICTGFGLDWDYSLLGLACYQDADIFYGQGDSCTYMVAVDAPQESSTEATCYYNAQTAQLNLQVPEAIWVGGFTLYDLQGRVAAAQSLAPHQAGYQIDISLLPSGIYAYVFTDRSGAAVQRGKVVVVR